MKKGKLQIFLLMVVASFAGCGGSTSETDAEETPTATSDTVNTEKLIGTPFEGLTTGDDFDWDLFLCNQYRTETIDTLPIKIFAAFFTTSEEAIVQEGIDVANTAMGSTTDGGVFYELTDTWSDDVRVIYRVDEILNEDGTVRSAEGRCRNVEARFNSKNFAETFMPDWKIELTEDGINNWTVAHELGHASGIAGHYLINYINDSIETLEENSIMEADGGGYNPVLDDYTYMMQQQATIMQNHLQEDGVEGTCAD